MDFIIGGEIMEMQKHIDNEKILVEQNRFNNYLQELENQIRQADNNRLRSYFLEYSHEIEDGKAIQNVFNFVQWIIANK
jgi:hypothetical protein